MKELFSYFLKLGLTGFGGPLALVSSMQKDLVEKKHWMSMEDFQRAFALIKSMPGPIAFSTAVYLGHHRKGFLGGLLAAIGVVGPAFVMMLVLAAFLAKFSQNIYVFHTMLGMQIAALAVIMVSLQTLARGFEKDFVFWVLVGLAFVCSWFFPAYEPVIIIGFGVFSTFALSKLKTQPPLRSWFLFVSIGLIASGIGAQAWAEVSSTRQAQDLLQLLWVCFKAGTFVFGSGLAIIPMLESEVVHLNGWMTQNDFLNAVALGQVTPGPVVITATVIGYQVSGFAGAVLATLAIFFSSFVHMTTWFPRVVRELSKKSWIKDFMRGALAAVLGSILYSVLRLSEGVEWTINGAIIGVVCLVVAYFKWLPAWAVIPLGGSCILGFSLLGF